MTVLRTRIGKMNKYCIFLLMEFILYTHSQTQISLGIYMILGILQRKISNPKKHRQSDK